MAAIWNAIWRFIWFSMFWRCMAMASCCFWPILSATASPTDLTDDDT